MPGALLRTRARGRWLRESLVDALPLRWRRGLVDRRPGERVAEPHLPAELDEPGLDGGSAAPASTPSRLAARHTRTGSPVSSAAAMSSSSRVAGGSGPAAAGSLPRSGAAAWRQWAARTRRPALRGSAAAAAPATRPGLPWASATIRLRTRSSIGPIRTEASSSRASPSASPPTGSSGSPASSCSPPGWRTARTTAAGAAARWRATKARACTESGPATARRPPGRPAARSAAASDSRVKAARPAANRSGGVPSWRWNAVPSASRCGSGQPPEPVQERRAQLVQPGERHLRLWLSTRRPHDAAASRALHQVLQQRRLAGSRPRRAAPAPGSGPPARPRPAGPAPRTRGGGHAGCARAPPRQALAPKSRP